MSASTFKQVCTKQNKSGNEKGQVFKKTVCHVLFILSWLAHRRTFKKDVFLYQKFGVLKRLQQVIWL